MDFKNKLLYLLLLIMTSCVSTNFDAYQSLDNLRIEKKYYVINEPGDNKNYVTIGIHTIINRQNDYYIYVAFKNKLSTKVDIESLNFGKIEKSSEDENVYIKKIGNFNSKTDTISIKFPEKVYKFYHNKNDV